jgi:N-acetylglucosamine-6-sulfatase
VAKGEGDSSRVHRALLWLLLSLFAFLAVGCSRFELAQQEQAESPTIRPNIILVLTDDLDFAAAQQMPELHSSLIEEGASFVNAFVSYPLCCPSRATILTGLYAHNHGVKGNEPPDGGFPKFFSEGQEENTIAARLQKSGYQTALIGKYLNNYPNGDISYVPPGWDQWYAVETGSTSYYDYELNENGEVVTYGKKHTDYLTDVLSSKAMDYVRGAMNSSEPFFLYFSPSAPHLPAIPAKRHRGALAEETAPRPPSIDEEDVSDKPPWVSYRPHISTEEASAIDDRYRRRLESMLAVDEMISSLIRELDAAHELENTFIFFTSDNGWQQGEHRINLEKDYPYEESIHVPLFVRGPGIAPESTVQELALNTDLAPTFADLAGVEFPADGRSLVPFLRGEEPQWRSAVLLEGWGENFRFARTPAYKAVRTESHKYVEYETGERELYDLQVDPYELKNIYESANPSLIEDLKKELGTLRGCADAGCQEAEDTSITAPSDS